MLSLIPKDARVFDFLEGGGRAITAAYDRLRLAVGQNPELTAKEVAAARELACGNNAPAALLIAHLNRTFVTPLDRNGLHALISAMETLERTLGRAAVVRAAAGIAGEGQTVESLVQILGRAVGAVARTLPMLRETEGLERALEPCVEVARLVNEAEDLALPALVDAGPSKRELLVQQINAMDAALGVAQAVRALVVMHA